MPERNKLIKIIVFGLTGILMGILFISQSSSVGRATLSFSREAKQSVFKEIQTVKQSNDVLKEEIEKLKNELEENTSTETALKNIQDEIQKYSLITGKIPAIGEGIILELGENLMALWLTDIINELNNAGAEIIEINGIRITNKSIGFDTIPNGQIMMSGNILKSPFIFKAIGDSKTLSSALSQPGGLIQRLNEYNNSIKIELREVENLEIK